MKLIHREHIELWASTTFSKSNLPFLISKLIRATTNKNTKIHIPSGSATYIGGWDGTVKCKEETAYVPEGDSLWEFGTSKDVNLKANKDYDKRKENPLGFTPKDSVFIFVTPRCWKGKDNWINEKKKENHWKDVIAYDSIEIEQWLDDALAVARWFAEQDGVSAYPIEEIMTAEEFWEEWSIGPNKLELLPGCLISGREDETESLFNTLNGKPTIKGIKASTKDEAIAFIIASAKMFPADKSQCFFSRTLLIDTEGNYRRIRTNKNSFLNMIPRFENAQPLYAAVSSGHHVLVPLGADDQFNQETIVLPNIDRDGQVKALISSGIDHEKAEKYSRESGRNITILKKLLGFPYYGSKWKEKEDIQEIIPALLIGRWDENFNGDKEIIEKVSGQKYSNYFNTLSKWEKLENSPIIRIGDTWRLTSPLDLWTTLYSYLVAGNFKILSETFFTVFFHEPNVADPKEDTFFLGGLNKKQKYSNWVREGLVQSLILISRIGESISNPHQSDSQNWVDKIVERLLNKASKELWLSINRELPLLAEASPTVFLKTVNDSLAEDQPEIIGMFVEKNGGLFPAGQHTGLLWALESLAWLPEYLHDSISILFDLAICDPGGRISNRPMNSIIAVFKPWHYQTLAPFDKRMEILKLITKRDKELSWSLLLSLLPNRNDIAHPTHKMRWRMFDKSTKLKYTYHEIYETYTSIIELLFDLFDNTENKFVQIIEKTTKLTTNDRSKVLDWAEKVCLNVNQENFESWATIRKILNHHRSFPTQNWALSKEELSLYQKLYDKLEPKNIIDKYIWLFNKRQPDFPEGFIYTKNESEKRHRQQERKSEAARIQAAEFFIQHLSLDKTLELRNSIKEVNVFGDILAHVLVDHNDVISVYKCLDDEEPVVGFVRYFFFRKSEKEGFNWIKNVVNDLQNRNYSNKAISNVLLLLEQNNILWSYISSLDEEIENMYWQNVFPTFYNVSDQDKVIGVQELVKRERYSSAINITSHTPNVFGSVLLLGILKSFATKGGDEPNNFSTYAIEQIMEVLYQRKDIQKSDFIDLEWLYLPLIDTYDLRQKPRYLEEELATKPEFFVSVLSWLYRREDDDKEVEERVTVNEKTISVQAGQSYRLLNSWEKIPGLMEDKSIDSKILKDWIKKVRDQAEKVNRLFAADIEIGKLLAKYPENVPEWPQECIFNIIEDINTQNLKSGYSIELFNKRSFSTRAPFDGGDIERTKSQYFLKLFDDWKIKYPNVAQIFKDLADNYLHDAKRIDDEAERRKLEY